MLPVDTATPRLHRDRERRRIQFRHNGRFLADDGTVYVPAELSFVSDTALTLKLDLPTWPAGTYDVRVAKQNSIGETVSDTLVDGFEVVQGGEAHLETNLVLPSAVGFAIPIRQTIWVEYRNTGTLAMPAPLFRLDGDHGTRLTLDPTIKPQGGFGGLPGTSDTVQFIGIGPGERPGFYSPASRCDFPCTTWACRKGHSTPV